MSNGVNKSRQLRAAYTITEDNTGLGIVEESSDYGKGTIGIYSIYIDKATSNRDAQVGIFELIDKLLNEGEVGRLLVHRFYSEKGHHIAYRKDIKFKRVNYHTGLTYEARLLSIDAINRGYDIREIFDNPIKFSIVETEKNEGAY